MTEQIVSYTAGRTRDPAVIFVFNIGKILLEAIPIFKFHSFSEYLAIPSPRSCNNG